MLRIADKQGMDAAFAAARFFLVGGEMHMVLDGEVPCGLPIPEQFYDMNSGAKESTWDVCPSCHFAFVPTLFRRVRLTESGLEDASDK